MPDTPVDNGFLVQWEQSLRHAVRGEPLACDFVSGAKGVQLTEAGLQSWREKRSVEVPELVVAAVPL